QANRDNVLAATAALTTVIASLNNKTEEKRHRVKVPGFVVNTVPLFTIDEFRSRYRLTRSAFEFVLGELMKYELLNQHEEPTSSKGIPGDKQLLIFLDYIGHQCNQSELEVLYDVSAGKVNEIVHSLPRKIVPTLSSQFIKWPTELEAHTNAEGTLYHSGFPNVLGAIDGSHIEISTASSDFTTRKYRQAITLQAVASRNLLFYDVFVGCSGRMHDARVFQYSPLAAKVQTGENMYGLHLLGDGAYPLLNGLLTPFVDNGNLSNVQKQYNKHLSVARQVVERAFGQLKARFRRLRYIYQRDVPSICYTIVAACTLHNICILKNEASFEEDLDDLIDDYQDDQLAPQNNNQTTQQKRWAIAESL
ncbi:hypothetical protein BOX15_Mlig018847g3, partial [Macrostomum lignano]